MQIASTAIQYTRQNCMKQICCGYTSWLEMKFLYWVSSACACWLVFHFSLINLFSTCWNIFTALSGFDTIIPGSKLASFLAKLYWRGLFIFETIMASITAHPEFQSLQMTYLPFLQGSAESSSCSKSNINQWCSHTINCFKYIDLGNLQRGTWSFRNCLFINFPISFPHYFKFWSDKR